MFLFLRSVITAEIRAEIRAEMLRTQESPFVQAAMFIFVVVAIPQMFAEDLKLKQDKSI